MESKSDVPGRTAGFLFLIAGEEDVQVDYKPRLPFRRVSIGRGDFHGGYPSVPDGQRLDAVEIVAPAELTELTVELLCSTGPWDRVADVEARKNVRGVTSFRDGGRRGIALMTSTGYDAQSLTAIASLALRDSEPLEEGYRLVALDDEANLLASTERYSSGGYVGQMVLECPPEMATPVKFQLQQRPKIPVVFQDLPLDRSAK